MQVALAIPDLSLAETKALTLLAEGFSLEECAGQMDVRESELAALVHALDLLGILVVPTEKENPGPPSSPVEQNEDRPLGSPEAQRARIQAKMEQVREGDYYSLLGVRPTSSQREIQAAYEQVRRSFDDQSLSEDVRVGFARELLLIRQALDEAAAVLTHPRYAALYREALSKERK